MCVFWKIFAVTFASLSQRILCIHNNLSSMWNAKVANYSRRFKHETFCHTLVILILLYKPRVRCRKDEVSNRFAVSGPRHRTHISDTEHRIVNQPLCLKFKVQSNPGHAVAQWLRQCATNRKVAGSIPDGVIGIFHWHNPSSRTIPGIFLGGKGGRCVRLTTLPPPCADCLKIWEPQPPGPLRACQGL
jgi:hypothetical protein